MATRSLTKTVKQRESRKTGNRIIFLLLAGALYFLNEEGPAQPSSEIDHQSGPSAHVCLPPFVLFALVFLGKSDSLATWIWPFSLIQWTFAVRPREIYARHRARTGGSVNNTLGPSHKEGLRPVGAHHTGAAGATIQRPTAFFLLLPSLFYATPASLFNQEARCGLSGCLISATSTCVAHRRTHTMGIMDLLR